MGEAALDTSAKQYRTRNPQNSQYYQCVQDHFEALEQVYDERFSRQYGFFRTYVKEVILRYPWPRPGFVYLLQGTFL